MALSGYRSGLSWFPWTLSRYQELAFCAEIAGSQGDVGYQNDSNNGERPLRRDKRYECRTWKPANLVSSKQGDDSNRDTTDLTNEDRPDPEIGTKQRVLSRRIGVVARSGVGNSEPYFSRPRTRRVALLSSRRGLPSSADLMIH